MLLRLGMNIFVTITFILSLLLNLPKIPYMIDSMQFSGTNYYIFPWQGQRGIVSKSSPAWLLFHLIISQVLVVMTFLKLLFPKQVIPYFTIIHYINAFVIGMNCIHFGDQPIWRAILINIGATLALCITFCYDYLFVYMCILCTPIFIEAYTVVHETMLTKQ